VPVFSPQEADMPPAPPRARRNRIIRAVLLVTLAAGTLLPAAPALAASRVRDVTIDCAGDVVAGHVTMTDPEHGTVRVVLYGATATGSKAPRVQLAETAVATTPWENEVAYSFRLPSRHAAYRVTATIGNSRRTSAGVGDPTCAPPAQVPEAGLAGLVLAVMAAAVGGVVWIRARRTARAGTPVG
jgi:hypothetical protein